MEYRIRQDSVVGTAIHYGLDSLGIKSWGGDLPHKSRPALYNGYQVTLTEVKRLGHGINYPPPSSAEVKERVKLYL